MTPQQLEELTRQVQTLPPREQLEVVDFVAFLKSKEKPRGTPGHTLMHLAGTLPDEDAREMMDAIDEGCGQIDKEGWN
jgi:hypothetical protein